MTTKRIRCSCGRVYDPVKRPACPDCGAPSPVITAPAPPPAPSEEKTKAPAREAKPPGPTSSPIPPKYLAIGAALLCLLALLMLVGRKGSHEKSAIAKRGEPAPSASAAPSSTPALTPTPSATATPSSTAELTPTPSATAIVRREPSLPTPAPSLPAENPTPPPAKIPSNEYDLGQLIANAAAGATIKVPPGTYSSVTLTRAIHLVGDSNAPVFIKGEGQSALSVKSTGVAVQNIQILCHGIGELPAVAVADGAELEINASSIQSGTAVGMLATGKASVKALDTTFAVPYGTGLQLTQEAKASLTQCSLSDTKTGLNAWSGATAELHSCAFERDGGNDGHGSVLALNGQGTTVTADDCRFNGNSAGLIVTKQASITITKSQFKNNAAAVEGGILGLISVRDSAHATLTGDSFESNRQGIAVTDGGTVEMLQCNLAANGLWQERQVIPASLPLMVSGQNSLAAVRKTGFTNSAQYAIGVMAGAKLTLEDVDISGSRNAGVILGERNMAPVRAEMKRAHINGNGTGLGLLAGSSAEIEDCEFRDNNDGIIVIDADSQLKATKTALISNRDRGLYVYSQADARMVDCDLKNNARGAQSGTRGRGAERASITLENCRLGGNRVFGAGACAQSELILTDCVFDGSDRTNIYKERGAHIETNNAPTPAPSPASPIETGASPTPEESVEPSVSPSPEGSVSPSPHRDKSSPKPRRKPTPRPRPPTPEDYWSFP